jgi:hypothetical protein
VNRIISRILATLFGLVCDRCHRRGAALVIDADRTSRMELDGGRIRISTFAVRGCCALCPACRGKR